MKTLYMVRHAKAVDRDGHMVDFERILSERGQHDAHTMAVYAQTHGPRPDHLISSPSRRAFETAHAFAQVYQLPVAQIRTYPCLYHDTSVDTFLELVQHLDQDSQTAMVFAHAPLCRESITALAPTYRQDIPPGAVVCLQFHVSSWAEVMPGRGVAIWSHDPKRKPSNHVPDTAITPLQAPAAITLQPTATFDPNRLVSALQQDAYTVRFASKTQYHATYLDTFDWRLYNRALTLQWQSPHLTLDLLSGHPRPSGVQPCADTLTAVPTYASDLPSGTGLRQCLEPITGIRALLPRFGCASQHDTWRLLNAEDKTVVRLVIERYACTHTQDHPHNHAQIPVLTRLRLKPLRGYAEEARQAQAWLLAHGFIPSQTPLYDEALAVLGITPNDYTAKPQLQFDPAMRGDAAMRSILRFLFTVMRRNETGVINDLDTEFLHDFRVASRRARSAVGQIKGIFAEPVQQRLKRDLASLGAMTNHVRDLDVYLLRQTDYRDKLPAHLQEAIEPLFDMLQKDRKQAFRSLTRKLRGKTYTDLMAHWETFFGTEPPEPDAETAPNAARPILKIAEKRLSKMSSRVVEAGNALLDHMDDDHLHELRIDCKKLRYLLEFFAGLFPQPAIDPVIKRLRKLQDELGDFNDCCVQQLSLESYAERFSEMEPTQQAILYLIDVLEAEKQAFKAAFPDRFKTFAATVSGKSRPWKNRPAKRTQMEPTRE